MATNFPTGLDSYVTKVDNVDAVLAAYINDPQDAIEALEAKLGVDSSTVASSIDYFLKNAGGEYRIHKHDGSADDGAATIGALTGITIANNVDVGNFQMRMKQLYADVATGTAPLLVDSTTVVSNLNADQVDGLDSTDIVQMTGNQSVAGVKTFSSFPVTPSSAPTTDYQTSNKKYVDDEIAALDAIGGIEDYGTSASSSTSKTLADLQICYGSISVGGNSSQAITNLPFTSDTSYKVSTGTYNNAGEVNQNPEISYNSGSQFTVINEKASTVVYSWIAIGT